MFTRDNNNPIVARHHINSQLPELRNVTSVFNPGAALFNGKTILLLRVQNRGRETFILKASSGDGVDFRIDEKPLEIEGLSDIKNKVYHLYDPRITKIDDRYLITLAMDFEDGTRIGIAETFDFESLRFIGFNPCRFSRNGVIFPKKFDGKFLMLERPNDLKLPGNVGSGDTIILSSSDDLEDWKIEGEVMKGRKHYWDELIGPGPPPILTEEGWLLIYHGVATHFMSNNIYQAGAVLLDADEPLRIIARSRYNLLEPRETYELTGQVPNVVFPSGLVTNQSDERILNLYYGAADTSVCLAYSTLDSLLIQLKEDSH